MSKEFAMLNASRRLENYLSRERYNLRRMEGNERIPYSLLESKVEHYNGLVDALNDLFGSLVGSSERLFSRYLLEGMEIDDEVYHEPEVTVELPRYDDVPSDDSIEEDDEDDLIEDDEDDSVEPEDEETEEQEPEAPEDEDDGELREPQWKLDGYTSEEEWLLDKDAESAELQDDLDVSVNPSLSRYRADKVLSEYSESAEQDISTYNPEDDEPVSVLPHEEEHESYENSRTRPTENLDYLNHTADKVRVDNDPTQIASVKTAVELDGEDARRGVDIDIGSYAYQSDKLDVGDLLGDEISKFRVTDDDDSDDDVENEDDESDTVADDDSDDVEDFEEEVEDDDEHYHEADDDIDFQDEDDISNDAVHDDEYDEEEEHAIDFEDDDDEGFIGQDTFIDDEEDR